VSKVEKILSPSLWASTQARSIMEEEMEAPKEKGLAGLWGWKFTSMPDGHCRWPSFRE
jgi:hypothetical protein